VAGIRRYYVDRGRHIMAMAMQLMPALLKLVATLVMAG
jgi:hypothetical protein